MSETTTDIVDASKRAADGWMATLAPDVRQVVEGNGHKTPAELAQAYASLQRTIGIDKITLPTDGIWDAAARDKLGIPKEASGYKLRRPDNLPPGMTYDEDFEKAALPVAHKLGLTPVQVQGLFDFYAAYASNAFKGDESAEREPHPDGAQ